MGRGWRVGTIGGIPVNIDSSWAWIAIFIVYSLWERLGLQFPDLGTFPALALAVLATVLFLGSVFLHELAHAIAARLNGIKVLGITLVFFGGYTSARLDERGPAAAFVIAAVGPATTLTIGVGFIALSRVLSSPTDALASAIGYIGLVNILMAIFNVLPGYPLDGGRMLEAAIWRITHNHERGTRVAATVGIALAAGLIVVAIYRGSANDLFGALWAVMIASLIYQGARTARQQLELRRRLAGATAADAMEPPPVAIPADMTLSEALDRFIRGNEAESFPVIEPGGSVIGVVSFESARPIGMRDPLRPVRDAIVPISQVPTSTEDEPLDQVVARLGSGSGALVLREGRLVGTISGRSVGRWVART